MKQLKTCLKALPIRLRFFKLLHLISKWLVFPQDKLTEYRNAEKNKKQTNKEKAKLILRRITAWLIAFLLIAVATGGIVLSIYYGPVIRKVNDVTMMSLNVCHFRALKMDTL